MQVAGYAVGGGHVLHMVCDLTIAAENAVFGQTGPKVYILFMKMQFQNSSSPEVLVLITLSSIFRSVASMLATVAA